MKKFVQDNGGLLAIMAVAVGILAAYGEWRISSNIDNALDEMGAVTTTDLAVLTTKQAAISDDIDELKGNDERIDSKLDRIVDILLEDE